MRIVIYQMPFNTRTLPQNNNIVMHFFSVDSSRNKADKESIVLKSVVRILWLGNNLILFFLTFGWINCGLCAFLSVIYRFSECIYKKDKKVAKLLSTYKKYVQTTIKLKYSSFTKQISFSICELFYQQPKLTKKNYIKFYYIIQ